MLRVVVTTFILCACLAGSSAQFRNRRIYLAPVEGDCRAFSIVIFGIKFAPRRCPNGVFSITAGTCVPEDDPRNDQCQPLTLPELRCAACPDGNCAYPYPDGSCATYIDCSKTTDDDEYDDLPRLVNECDYPQLFDNTTGQCEDPSRVQCNERPEPLDPCQYSRNQCGRSAHCRPCIYRFASCIGKSDGLHPWKGEWSPYFAVCQNQRTLRSTQCPTTRSGEPSLFSPRSFQCENLRNVPRQFGGLLDVTDN